MSAIVPDPLPDSSALRLHSSTSARKRTGITDAEYLLRQIPADGVIHSSTGKLYPVWHEATIEAWCAGQAAALQAEVERLRRDGGAES